jgi:uncharacterized protein YggU (UPF0235/DUF167 family)
MTAWTVLSDGVHLAVRLSPRGSRNAMEGVETGADGKAYLKSASPRRQWMERRMRR